VSWLRPLNDDHTTVPNVRPSSYGYAQPDPTRKSRRKKRPLGFIWPEPPEKPHRRAAKPKEAREASDSR
jgi:hypothetical protein